MLSLFYLSLILPLKKPSTIIALSKFCKSDSTMILSATVVEGPIIIFILFNLSALSRISIYEILGIYPSGIDLIIAEVISKSTSVNY